MAFGAAFAAGFGFVMAFFGFATAFFALAGAFFGFTATLLADAFFFGAAFAAAGFFAAGFFFAGTFGLVGFFAACSAFPVLLARAFGLAAVAFAFFTPDFLVLTAFAIPT